MITSNPPNLLPGEYALWEGAPPKGVIFRSADIFMIPFSLMWWGFALFWEVTVLSMMGSSDDPMINFFPLWGLIFVVIGFYFAIGRFIADAYVRDRTRYFLTNKRAIIATDVLGPKVKSYSITPASEINFIEHSNQTGSIAFGLPEKTSRPDLRTFMSPGFGQFLFERITSPQEAMSQILKIQSGK